MIYGKKELLVFGLILIETPTRAHPPDNAWRRRLRVPLIRGYAAEVEDRAARVMVMVFVISTKDTKKNKEKKTADVKPHQITPTKQQLSTARLLLYTGLIKKTQPKARSNTTEGTHTT